MWLETEEPVNQSIHCPIHKLRDYLFYGQLKSIGGRAIVITHKIFSTVLGWFGSRPSSTLRISAHLLWLSSVYLSGWTHYPDFPPYFSKYLWYIVGRLARQEGVDSIGMLDNGALCRYSYKLVSSAVCRKDIPSLHGHWKTQRCT